MADPLSLLRQYYVNKKEIVEKNNLICFGEYCWPKTVKTNYMVYGSSSNGPNKEYYTLVCLLFFLKNITLQHSAYVKKASFEEITVIQRSDRKDLLSYLSGETATVTSIDKSAKIELPLSAHDLITMNERAVEIIKIDKTSSNKSVYIFNKEEFSEIIESCNDCQIALISIAGPSRSGKSFLLSYFLNYLYGMEDDKSQMNKGFEWKKTVNPTTQGLWMWSKPFIFDDNEGTKFAVLLMDTQGVYDQFTDQRDWSTIFGISLLTSSCIIYNESKQLNENMFITFESYLNYGLMATGSANAKEPPFQNLMFLIRDWQNADEYDYGIIGGESFLESKLKVDKSMSMASKRSRKMLKQCFKEVSCCLMPDPGKEARENRNFDGNIKLLDENFVDIMEELFSSLLNTDTLNIKTICGEKVNGNDLLEYFQTYVKKFNSDEIPEPIDLVDATSKTHDVLRVIKFKEIYISDMRKELECERFLSLDELNELNAQRTVNGQNGGMRLEHPSR